LLTDLGFPRPESQNVDDFAAEVSLEQLDQADTVQRSPVWNELPAIKAGKVRKVDDQTWLGGIGYHAAFEVMDQIAKLVAA